MSAREIVQQWSTLVEGAEVVASAMPRFLENPLLADLVGAHGSVVVQVLDMHSFQSVYVSPNVTEITGFSPVEINRNGVWRWISSLPLSELGFQLRNAIVVGTTQRAMPPKTRFRSAMINGSMRTKAGGLLRIVSQNLTVSWDEQGRSHHQLFLWRDATHLFRSSSAVVRHLWEPEGAAPVVWTYTPDKGKFAKRELFSAREREILSLIEYGFDSKEIAERLGLSPLTVENHRKNVIARLQVRTTEAVLEVGKWLKLL